MLSMGPRKNAAAATDATIKLSKEESALSMGHRSNDAAVKDALIKLKGEECALDMGQTALSMMHPLHLEQNSARPQHLSV